MDAKGNPVWATCDLHTPYAFPWPVWTGGLVGAPDAKRLFIVIGRVVTFDAQFGIYEIDPRKMPEVVPSYDGKGKLKNRKELYSLAHKPDASFHKDFASSDSQCSMNLKIAAVELVGSVVRITAQGEQLYKKPKEVCVPKVFEYDSGSKKWEEPSGAKK